MTTPPSWLGWTSGDERLLQQHASEQVQVDGAYWQFTQTPPGALDRLQGARVHIPYPWVADETHHVVMLSAAGSLPSEMGAPGLDVTGIDNVALAGGYGMSARRANGPDELRESLAELIASPRLPMMRATTSLAVTDVEFAQRVRVENSGLE